jgi:hypothetical protein
MISRFFSLGQHGSRFHLFRELIWEYAVDIIFILERWTHLLVVYTVHFPNNFKASVFDAAKNISKSYILHLR